MTEPSPSMDEQQKEITNAVGQITVAWSTLEYTISILYDQFFPEDSYDIASITRNELNPRKVLNACKLMAISKLNPSRADMATRLLNFVDNEIRIIRNEYVHGHFDFSTYPTVRFRKTKLVKVPHGRPTIHLDHEKPIMLEIYPLPSSAIRHASLAMYEMAILTANTASKREQKELEKNIQQLVEKSTALIAEYKSRINSSDDTAPNSSSDIT